YVHIPKRREGESTRAFITRYRDDTLQILGLHKEQRISGFVHGLRTRSLVEHLSTDLPSTYKGLMEKTYTWVKAREVATNGASGDRGDNFESPKEILAIEKAARSFEPPPKMFGSKHLRTQIQEAVNSGQLSHLVKGTKKERTKSSNTPRGESKKDKVTAPAKAPIHMGIKANTSKVKAVTDLDQPRTLKDIQSLNVKLAALSQFLSKGAERSLAFFKVLKGCKDKKSIQWTTKADKALEKMKKLVQALPTLTAPRVGETLTMHLTSSKKV
ncbi:hypothetical protein Tco_1289761, partial [Tanacetum coccineum]